ncbi:nitrogenase cofactor biosynthesis protein NifB [Natranaerovirga hydrolytica]|uniref:FeMo cofactor biosynthesis protein NifB n=1 Tax=Natranaerovirga hydrolytica TaxID=680378 RepID=A0A4R1MJK9_9FIRM|nr:nitrogenase cofactor biosynthesis protein NifB [Natranaerovirga hydrolytica]TCK92906.1 nitrogenase cofactor biosynthesis protein NifB [Natranaerovirga hydrolytica]
MNISMDLMNKTSKHPCYSEKAHEYARMHIPVAPKCNIKCNYCNRKYDCQNESRPGVTSSVMTPEKALKHYIDMKEKVDKLSVVGIAGPGDALANFEEVEKSIELIKAYDEEVTFCLSTNGIALPDYMKQIVELGVNHVTITINAIDPEIAANIYKFVIYRGIRYQGVEAGRIIINNQLEGLKFLAMNNVLVKVNIVYIKGENEDHIEEVVKKTKELGACMTNIMPLIPVKNTPFERKERVTQEEILKMRKKCEKHLQQMYHCKQCRADAVGRLNGKGCCNKKEIS